MSLGRKLTGAGLAIAVVALVGCGSASNDQGISLTFVGLAAPVIDEETRRITCVDDNFTNVFEIPLGRDFDLPFAFPVIGCAVIQNNMTSAAARTERVFADYYIPGASEQPPSTSFPLTITAGADAQGVQVPPGGIASIPNRVAGAINIIPPEIASWISLNRNSLPEAPFSMEISMTIKAVSSAGDQLETNAVYVQGQVVNDLGINPGFGDAGDTEEETN